MKMDVGTSRKDDVGGASKKIGKGELLLSFWE